MFSLNVLTCVCVTVLCAFLHFARFCSFHHEIDICSNFCADSYMEAAVCFPFEQISWNLIWAYMSSLYVMQNHTSNRVCSLFNTDSDLFVHSQISNRTETTCTVILERFKHVREGLMASSYTKFCSPFKIFRIGASRTRYKLVENIVWKNDQTFDKRLVPRRVHKPAEWNCTMTCTGTLQV